MTATNEEQFLEEFARLAVQNLRQRGFTNLTEVDLRRDPSIWWTNMFTISATLPSRITDWPAPEVASTNWMGMVREFVDQHGWSMENGPDFQFALGPRAAPITGLPWPQISTRTFRAVTRDGILYVVLRNFGPDCDGVAWNPQTNRFDKAINMFQPLGLGWYAWTQTVDPTTPADRRYEGEKEESGQQDGAANGSQPIRSETNATSSAAGSRR